MKQIAILLLAVVLIATTKATAQAVPVERWIPLTTLQSDSTTYSILKKKPINVARNRKHWIKTYHKSYTYNNRTYRDITLHSLYVVDCNNRELGIEEIIIHKDGNSSILEDKGNSLELIPVVPNSIEEKILDIICNYQPNINSNEIN